MNRCKINHGNPSKQGNPNDHPPDEGKHSARGGTRTAFPPPHTLDSPDMRNPARFEGRSVDKVHIPKLPSSKHRSHVPPPRSEERTPDDLGITHLNSDDPRAHVLMASIKLMRSRRPV